ncbi:5-methylcytosine restriction system specificity protein McrC [Nosocomiicoccus ampullae]|uniref:5-methylcytosine-specific restriction enzyme subunit McrC n=1 Tax=Nosocomiicoccus ampullae TaxID=489910 RepID=A0A9Q2CY92_9STAP|nr:hypothetical protein [Nosocomiicoccus ampullae]MBB5175505.1 5-methylcytosine-specific restriction enzyme subunit McrC [Nosocomiicoccus ampullae]QYA46912.1 hypothetical protein KPF49_00185 [Nosocomiicoccus ampullae]
MKNIPIKNIYYMALYALDLLDYKYEFDYKNYEKVESIHDVLLSMYLRSLKNLESKGLRNEYIREDQKSYFIKGKINVLESLRQVDGSYISEVDNFSEDNLLNQILKAQLVYLSQFDSKFRRDIGHLLLKFQNVRLINLKGITYPKNFNRLNNHYRFSLQIGKFLYESSIPSEQNKDTYFKQINDNEIMHQLFESFIFKYYLKEHPYIVKKRSYSWNLNPLAGSDIDLIPTMNTDIEIETPNKYYVIDAKYYQSAFSERYKRRFKSENMYQIYAYMNRVESKNKIIQGILLYPSNGYDFFEQFILEDGKIISFKTVNLSESWTRVKNDLDEIFWDTYNDY